MAETIQTANEPELSLLIVDDDEPWLNRLARAMESRGFSVNCAASVAEGVKLGKSVKPNYAVVDMRLEDGNGLTWLKACVRYPQMLA